MAPTLLLYGIPSIVDERCLYQLFNHKVKQALFSGFNLGRIAIVELTEDALTTAVLRQSCAGLILANSLNAKKAQKAIRANARKEAEEAKKKNKRGGKKGSKGEEEKEENRTDSLDDPSKGITLLELLHQEFGGQALAPAAASSSSSSSGTTATSSSPSTPSQFMAQFGGATPEFGLYSTILINGHRVGVAVSPLTIDEFKAFGGEMATRPPPRNNKSETGVADAEANDGQQAPPRKQRRTEANAELKTDESDTAAIETSTTVEVPTSSSGSSSTANVAKHNAAAGKKEVVLQSTRMRNVNQQAPAFGAALSSAASKNKITFSDDDDDDDAKPKKTTPVAEDKQKEVKKKDAAEVSSNGDAASSSLNNRERKKLAKAAASTTASKFKFADSDSD